MIRPKCRTRAVQRSTSSKTGEVTDPQAVKLKRQKSNEENTPKKQADRVQSEERRALDGHLTKLKEFKAVKGAILRGATKGIIYLIEDAFAAMMTRK